MNVGYVPDSFGQAASMPQIYREFGITDTMFGAVSVMTMLTHRVQMAWRRWFCGQCLPDPKWVLHWRCHS